MIIDDITPTNDVSVVSVAQVQNRLKLADRWALHKFLRRTLKYIAYHEPVEEEPDIHKKQPIRSNRLLMPLDTALRLIKDAEAGRVFAKAKRL